jgi:RNA polymerase sigma-70 factor (ECF subfamily)
VPVASAPPEAIPASRDLDWLVATHYGEVFRFLYRLSRGDRALAEDLTQEAFLRACRAFARLPADANHRAWIYRVAFNGFVSARRGARATARLKVDVAARGHDHDGGELLEAVRAFIDTLPPKQRAALILRRVDGRDYAEIAEMLGCSEEAARASLSEALRKLRQRFHREQVR